MVAILKLADLPDDVSIMKKYIAQCQGYKSETAIVFAPSEHPDTEAVKIFQATMSGGNRNILVGYLPHSVFQCFISKKKDGSILQKLPQKVVPTEYHWEHIARRTLSSVISYRLSNSDIPPMVESLCSYDVRQLTHIKEVMWGCIAEDYHVVMGRTRGGDNNRVSRIDLGFLPNFNNIITAFRNVYDLHKEPRCRRILSCNQPETQAEEVHIGDIRYTIPNGWSVSSDDHTVRLR